jgi:ABC-2 type transport system permease protein
MHTMPVNEGWLFQRLRYWRLRNAVKVLLAQSSPRIALILFFSVLIALGVFGASFEGFHYMAARSLPLVGGLVGMLFDLLFFALAAMLVFSTGIILYSSLFSAAESGFLLASPARADQIFAYKYQGAIAFSSWAFLLLGAPIFVAYGIAAAAPWYYYPLLPLFFLGYVLLPGCVGAICCLLVVNCVPRGKRQMLIVSVVLVLFLAIYWVFRFRSGAEFSVWNRDDVQALATRFSVAQGTLMPNHWMSTGLQVASQGDKGERKNIAYYLALLWANGLALYVLTAWLARRLYRRGYDRLWTGGTLRRRYGGGWLDRLLDRSVGFLDPRTRLLIVKDFRTFRRDPAQWAQILIFGGLMTLYFANMRRLYINDITDGNRNGISFLNLCATALLLCTYTSRFIYPMLSLEGRKFWILGLLPLERERLLWGKYAFSATGALAIAEFLVVLSDVMLEMPWLPIVLHVITVAVLALGLSGLSVGLGAMMPNFRETDPSKIAVGFGGTLNLVSGLLFIGVSIALLAGVWHAVAMTHEHIAEPMTLQEGILVILCLGLGLIIGLSAIVLPLRLGSAALRKMEF